MQIMVLCGGDSAEREVSLRSGARVALALAERGHEVTRYEHSGGALPIAVLREAAVADALFLALHGGEGEDGRLQARLVSCGIFHYTGSAPRGSAMAMAKDVARELVSAVGIPVAKGVLLRASMTEPPLPLPCVVKPRTGGSSIGLRFVHTVEEWKKITPYRGLLCETYLPGREFTVGILGGKALPVVEIRPRGGQYDYRHKYTAGASEELCPAPLSVTRSRGLQKMALTAFSALGLRDYARIDFREDEGQRPHFLEANALPGMTATSLFPLAAGAAGIGFGELCERMAAMAAARKRRK